jgi:hypothetical protein
MLGACDEIFVTDDSPDTVSEAVTAGHRAVLLRTERRGMLRKKLQALTGVMVSSGLVPRRVLWGAPKFDVTFGSFRKMGLLIDFKDWIHERRRADLPPPPPDGADEGDGGGFNEARRAADWILRRIQCAAQSGED